MRSGVANCALPEIFRPSAMMSLRMADLGRHTKRSQHVDNRSVETVVPVEAIAYVPRHEAEIQIAEVVVDGSAPRDATHDANAARRHDVGVDLLDRVLVPADDDGRRIDVEEEQVVVAHAVPQDVLLEREVELRVGDAGVVDVEHLVS